MQGEVIDYNPRMKRGDSNANILQAPLQGVCCHDLQYKINETSMYTHSLIPTLSRTIPPLEIILQIIPTRGESTTEECVYVYTYVIYR